MKLDGPGVDFITVINVLPACVNVGVLEQVKNLHGYSVKLGLNMLASVNTALLVSYAKCGCIEMARKLFDEEKITKDIITWNSMISAYAKHGASSQCFKLYSQMRQSNLKPDELSFLGPLTACVNSSLVKEGQKRQSVKLSWTAFHNKHQLKMISSQEYLQVQQGYQFHHIED
ncbi:pentatricopeptide repeat-containing protein, putative [Ricinus communis]|uniref:Pentatricopeptide repeat-containing protein, putative n=1 Tax=Ricinus communis TaxID=3988 RepID=B9T809_RICCO|nr:pentatricopeptide repeat-containing protein, putative [Ricinus communis]